MNISQVAELLQSRGEPRYRLDQIRRAYFKELAGSYSELTSLSLELRSTLESQIPFAGVTLKKIEGTLPEGVVKALLRLEDGLLVESVLIKHPHWITVCLSTQVGCPLGCAFCATGALGFSRNLTPPEIYEQVVFWNRFLQKEGKKGEKVTHLVFMGMGEPFLNWDNLWESLHVITDPRSLGFGERKISISTAGVTPRIREFTTKNSQINLAVSLNAPNQVLREHLMPIAKKYPLTELLDACLTYVTITKRKLFWEYVLINEVNDSPELARDLAALVKKHYLYHLNLIGMNQSPQGLTPATADRVAAFAKVLKTHKVNYTFRRSYGASLSAACGQLAGTSGAGSKES